MKATVLTGGFGLENLASVELPVPECGPNQVLVRVRAVALNARDLMIARGEYNPRQKLPLVLGSDAAGEIVRRGSSVTRFQVGQRVCPIFASLWQAGPLSKPIQQSTLGGPLDGTLRQYIALDENAVVRAPAHLSDVEAACLPCAGVTAYRAVVESGRLARGEYVVCIGTGGVSLFGARIARALGAHPILLSRSAEKLSRARALGFELCIDTSQEPVWGHAVRSLTGGEGAQLVLEVGGSGTFEQSLRAVRLGGTLSVIGVLSGVNVSLDLRSLLMQDVRLQGVFVGSRETFLQFVHWVELTQMKPDVDRVFPLHEARAAFEHLASGTQFGKVVITLD